MYKLVLLRHGESDWNRENRFTGWTDVDLSARGVEEALFASVLLHEEGYEFDIAYTSLLVRAIRTLNLVLEGLGHLWIPVVKDWRLNERHYGALQGLNKAETAQKFGEEQVLQWRRSYDLPPPALEKNDERFPGKDRRYADVPQQGLPCAESLKDTIQRFLPLWETDIEPAIRAGKRIIIAAHGNSLRALIKHLDNISDEDILALNIPTGIPLIYDLDKNLRPIKSYYLGDQDVAKKALQSVASQGKAG